LSILRVKQWHGLGLNAALTRGAGILRGTITDNPELFLPVACLFVWQFTAIAAKPSAFACALLLTLLLCIYGHRVLGTTEWLRRLGWASPRQGFWLYSLIAGLAGAGGVWWFARIFHQSLGGVPPLQRILLASSSGPMIEEMLFRRPPLLADIRALEAHWPAARGGRRRDSTSHGNCLRALSQ
jgi:hypothetical protein